MHLFTTIITLYIWLKLIFWQISQWILLVSVTKHSNPGNTWAMGNSTRLWMFYYLFISIVYNSEMLKNHSFRLQVGKQAKPNPTRIQCSKRTLYSVGNCWTPDWMCTAWMSAIWKAASSSVLLKNAFAGNIPVWLTATQPGMVQITWVQVPLDNKNECM